MEVVLRKNTTDDEMIDIVTTKETGNIHDKEILWGVVHSDFIEGEIMMKELLDHNGEITVILEVKL
jgi:hypothetical protein